MTTKAAFWCEIGNYCQSFMSVDRFKVFFSWQCNNNGERSNTGLKLRQGLGELTTAILNFHAETLGTRFAVSMRFVGIL